MSLLRRVLLYLDVIRRLGFLNVAYVAWYRFSLKCGIRKFFFPQRQFTATGPFFHPENAGCQSVPVRHTGGLECHPTATVLNCSDAAAGRTASDRDCLEAWKSSLLRDAEQIRQGTIRYYAHHWRTVGEPPDWFLNPFNGRIWQHPHQHWTTLDDFHAGIGDIKNIWEASRFEWAVTLARAYAVSGESAYLDTLNRWLGDWAMKNPVNTGPNWKCGQEASIRIFNLLLAAYILKQWQHPSPALQEFVYRHLERIHTNIRYAIAQDNNHGTSEAAALFIGGLWCGRADSGGAINADYENASLSEGLSHWQTQVKMTPPGVCADDPPAGNNAGHSAGNAVGDSRKKRRQRYHYFARQGRKWLENRLEKLVEEDGSFSQHSVTYHRVLLDTLIFAEFGRRQFDAEPFSDLFYRRSQAALSWLCAMTDTRSGNAPNLGANDGAMLLHAHSCDYRDFRPSIQTASALFNGRSFFAGGPWDEPGYWLGLNGDGASAAAANAASPTTSLAPEGEKLSQVLPGGYVIMTGKRSWAMHRFPMFRFRPGHNDVFHFDLWFNGKNICRDGGSYSYHPDVLEESDYFASVKAHNTVAFDDTEQMPRLGRFMLGQWIREEQVGAIEQADEDGRHWTGSYRDYRGNRHRRKIAWKEDTWVIEDDFAGRFEDAKVVYRLIPDDYQIEGNSVMGSWGRIDVAGEDFEMVLSEGFESLYYWQKQPLPVLVLRIGKNFKKITTRFLLAS